MMGPRDHLRAARRLLIADDEQTILDLLAASLRFAGFEVVTAVDGRDALSKARKASRRHGARRHDAGLRRFRTRPQTAVGRPGTRPCCS